MYKPPTDPPVCFVFYLLREDGSAEEQRPIIHTRAHASKLVLGYNIVEIPVWVHVCRGNGWTIGLKTLLGMAKRENNLHQIVARYRKKWNAEQEAKGE